MRILAPVDGNLQYLANLLTMDVRKCGHATEPDLAVTGSISRLHEMTAATCLLGPQSHLGTAPSRFHPQLLRVPLRLRSRQHACSAAPHHHDGQMRPSSHPRALPHELQAEHPSCHTYWTSATVCRARSAAAPLLSANMDGAYTLVGVASLIWSTRFVATTRSADFRKAEHT